MWEDALRQAVKTKMFEFMILRSCIAARCVAVRRYLITRSALATIFGGIVSPIGFAVLRIDHTVI
jgi:hypothetical protein